MAIYGLNFNSKDIPMRERGLFKQTIRLNGVKFYLQGICNTMTEAGEMVLQAERPGRSVHVDTHKLFTTGWIGVYCS